MKQSNDITREECNDPSPDMTQTTTNTTEKRDGKTIDQKRLRTWQRTGKMRKTRTNL
jgi:hypothetical protein